jgi:hypothetical protein
MHILYIHIIHNTYIYIYKSESMRLAGWLDVFVCVLLCSGGVFFGVGQRHNNGWPFLWGPFRGPKFKYLSVSRQVHSLFQTEFSKECDLELPPIFPSVMCFSVFGERPVGGQMWRFLWGPF